MDIPFIQIIDYFSLFGQNIYSIEQNFKVQYSILRS